MISRSRASVLSFTLLVVAGIGQAHASYYVSTFASAEAGAYRYSLAPGYNHLPTATGPTLTGSTLGGGCPSGLPSNISCSATVSGSTSSSIGLTAAYDQAQLIVTDTSPAYSLAAAASAYANLASGKIGVSSSGNYDFVDGYSGQFGGNGSSWAEINDTLHFHVAGPLPPPVTPIGLTFTVDGSWTVTTATGDSQGGVTTVLVFGGAQFIQDVATSGGNNWIPAVQTPTISGWASYTLTPDTPTQITFTGVYDLVGASGVVGIDMRFYAACGLGTACDYSHTGAISLTLPRDVSFTSDSGAFLTSATPVPEPTSLAILAGALGLLPLRRRGSCEPVRKGVASTATPAGRLRKWRRTQAKA